MTSIKTQDPARKIFLSYSSKDDDAATAIRQSLSDHGLDVWSSHDIKPGDNVAASIQREINEADDVLILLSPTTEANSWMEFEAAAAVAARESSDHQKRIIPVLLDSDVHPPPVLARFNYLDLSTLDKWPHELDRLVRTIQLKEPLLSHKEEKRLEREHLAIEQHALKSARMDFEMRAVRYEHLFRLAQVLAAFISVTALLLLTVLGVFGQINATLIALLGVAAGALTTSLITAGSD